MLPTLLQDCLNLLYPPRCPFCSDSDIPPQTTCCEKCAISLTHLSATPSCPQCASPLGEGAACPYCEGAGIHPFDRIVALGPFRDPLRQVIHQIKYHHRWPVAEILAKQLLRQPRVMEVLQQTDRLIPVPLHWSRHITRGYNQAASIAGLLRRPGIKVIHPIVRLKNTPTQTTTHNRAQRAENLRNAFGLIDPDSIRNQRITLVDDVMTTAATLKSAAKAINQAKPRGINAIVLAVADPRRHDFTAV